jgi:Holliday junction DNA helicase RuvA
MIRIIEGTVRSVHETSLVVMVGGIGYQVHTTEDTLRRVVVGEPVVLFTHFAVREQSQDLYGFLSEYDRTLFELLLSVSGVGPKSALNILSLASPDIIKTAVKEQNPVYLSKTSGIGKKTAEKIVYELKEKVHVLGEAAPTIHGDEDALEALTSMGYTLAEAREALKRVPSAITSSNARLKEALKKLA